ncbi:MAG: hypothetical protein EOM05_10200 [Clostridia bacterium]|nr:hypothetical protein [Clostridia bacterium]
MKRIASLLLCLILIFSLTPSVFAADSGLQNFQKIFEYTPGKFSDVKSDSWYAENVKVAYELGLVQGNSETTFNSTGNITLAETLALACRLHRIYNTGKVDFEQGVPWYQVYVDYAFEKGILSSAFSDYSKAATRAQFALILSKALPIEALSAINNIPDDTIPDVPSSASYSKEVYCLYRAGVITGIDSTLTFNPNTTIERNEVATIVARMAIGSLRISNVFVPNEDPLASDLISIAIEQSAYISTYEKYSLQITTIPNEAKINSITWSSSDSSIATVTNGIVTGIKYGVAVITAKTIGGGLSNCEVTVGPQIDYDNVTFSDSLQFFFFITAVMPDHIQTPMGTVETAIQPKNNSFYSVSPTYELNIPVWPRSEFDIFRINNTPGYSNEEKAETIKILKDYQYKIYQYADHYFPNAKLMGCYYISGYRYEYIREGFSSNEFAVWSNFSNMPQIDKTSPKSSFRWCE